MSADHDTHAGTIDTATTALRQRVRTTGAAIRLIPRHPAALAVGIVASVVYLGSYLWALNLLSVRSGLGVSVLVVEDPLGRLFDRTGPVNFESIAIVDLELVRLLVAPIDLFVGGALAVLVGLNIGLAALAIIQPKACGIGAGSGFAASIPALLSGSACCAPVIAVVLGIQLGGTLLTILPWLLPIGAVALLGSLVYVGGLVGVPEPETAVNP